MVSYSKPRGVLRVLHNINIKNSVPKVNVRLFNVSYLTLLKGSFLVTVPRDKLISGLLLIII